MEMSKGFGTISATRIFRLNPIKLVMLHLGEQLRTYKFRKIKHKRDQVVYAPVDLLSSTITNKDIETFYEKSGVFDNHND